MGNRFDGYAIMDNIACHKEDYKAEPSAIYTVSANFRTTYTHPPCHNLLIIMS